MEETATQPDEFNLLDHIRDYNRESYILTHAPQILAALIVRRSSTSPDHLIGLALQTAGDLYDQVHQDKPN